MSHLGRGTLRRILGGEGGTREDEHATEHIVSCDHCRALAGTLADELRAERPGIRNEGPLQLVFDLIDRERQWGIESLSATAEWVELRRISNRRSQRDRVRMTKACHTIPFFRLVVSELKEEPSWDEAEFIAGLALLCIEAMSQRQQITQACGNDFQAEVWTAVANARRQAVEWKRAHQALDHAERHLKLGAGEPRLKAALLSIAASTLADEGQMPQALEALERCRAIYEGLSEWALLARTLIKVANILVESEPANCLAALDRAIPLIPAEDSYLKLLADLLRVECLIDAQLPSEALLVFRRCSRGITANPRIRMRIRGRFTSARLLDAFGLEQQAERLFNEVVASDIEHEFYKDALLDLLYLYGRHMKAGDLEKAARVCQRALADPSLAAITHEQLRDLWSNLLEATQHHAISQESLRDLRQYINAHWKHPAATPPGVRV
jgi:tetratricopeptide (TPR) repeat protein